MSTGRILVVDDEPQIRRALRVALSGHGVLLDVNMPGMSGLAACREIRAGSDAAIIMLTVRNSEKDKVTALDAGADDYITKPFGVPELSARIRAALRRLPAAQGSEDELIRLDGVEIDLSMRRVRKAGKELRLTPKEYDLLHYLAANPHTAITHTKLLQVVWGPDYGDQVEYLRVFVNQLRKKIEPDPSRPRYLLTEPWVGYRFDPPAR